jgi:O-antigen ligase
MTLASRQPGRRLVRLILVALAAAVVLAVSPWGEKAIEYLPFVGDIDQRSVTYRKRLFEISMQVIGMDPWLGSPYFMNAEPMQELRSGHLIDIVNSYLMIALRYGYVGLVWFCAVFTAAFWAVITALRRQPNEDTERFAQGQAILGMLFAVLVTIATVSDISFIPILWWVAAGLAIGYGHLVAREAQPEPVARRRFAMGSS